MSESTTREERFARGLEVLGSVNPEVGQLVVDSLNISNGAAFSVP
jgi:4-carboxymuconolactone decarboxylase